MSRSSRVTRGLAYFRTSADTDLDEIFLFEAKRKVQKDRTVSLDGVLYELDAALVNETVLLRYDPGGRRGAAAQGLVQGPLYP